VGLHATLSSDGYHILKEILQFVCVNKIIKMFKSYNFNKRLKHIILEVHCCELLPDALFLMASVPYCLMDGFYGVSMVVVCCIDVILER
jgi:hypothetical protein